jgi:hypothetical protein
MSTNTPKAKSITNSLTTLNKSKNSVKKKVASQNGESAGNTDESQSLSDNGEPGINPEATTLSELKNNIKNISSEDEVDVLKSIVDILDEFHDIVQEKLRQVIRDREGNEINPDGKISFEPVSKKTEDKEYIYTRASWKEEGVKKGKSLPQISKKIVYKG